MQVLAFLLVLAIVLMVRLSMLTTLQHDKWAKISNDVAERSIYVEAPRGEIYDRYGRLLAGNKQSFSVRISGSGLSKEELNSNIETLIGILDKNGDTFEDNFPIEIDDGKVLSFENGIVGFPDLKKFALMHDADMVADIFELPQVV